MASAAARRRRARPFYFKELETKRFADLDGKSKAVFTRADNSMAHKALRRWWPRRRGRGGVTVVMTTGGVGANSTLTANIRVRLE